MDNKQLQRQSRVVWFEIPATDLDRASGFYEQILNVTLRKQDFGGFPLAVFPYEAPAISGCVIKGEPYKPGANGPVVYVNADPSLEAVLARVEAAGGKVLAPKTDLPEGMGCFALVLDTEGNRVGLHAMQ